ncbi:TonB-dependent receptor [Pedobacter sp. SD-b]|uniref:TonB-dependent receptor n=1 Tax=Pedobacter segetis TaxID=2793069 RepID=A0ABS1BGY0_9SPHI|nr:TonB-dependent receptor [Pedobacter segetis]MBK0382130.1 TonB-dependent receptor [Pedobacter segetis]
MNIKNYPLAHILYKRHLKFRLIYFTVFFIFINKQHVFSQQKVTINANNIGLNKVLTNLRDSYAFNVSFNDDKLSTFNISLKKEFNTPEKALKYLLKGLPLKVEVINNVFVISDLKVDRPINYILSGNISDAQTNETLPLSTIVINGLSLISDQKGNFSFSSKTDSIFSIQIVYLGYLKLDTIVDAKNYLAIKLKKSNIQLSEVVLSSFYKNPESNTFYSAGNLRINHNISENLPGGGDNSVYNILRLQPGILASGDQSNDLLIWGSYQGQTKISFDGFTIFGLRNFNDNIGAVNPLIAKDLNVQKGGYGVAQGDRVGGVVDIVGIEGNTTRPNLKIGLDNLTLNGVASTPLFKNTALVIAARQTYYNVYDPYKLGFNSPNKRKQNNVSDYNVIPDYNFNDLNIKFSGKSLKGDNYYISLFNGSDDFSSIFNTTQGRFKIDGGDKERNNQYGATANYGKIWGKGSISTITVSSSGLKSNRNNNVLIDYLNNDQNYNTISELFNNNIKEQSIKFTHLLPTVKNYSFLFGAGFINNNTLLTQDSVNSRKLNEANGINRFYSFVENNYFIIPKIKITPGLRIDYAEGLNKTYLQPRLAAQYQVDDQFKLSAAWGIYNQFIAYTETVDEQGNLNYNWAVCDDRKVPVYDAQHWVLGANYQKNNWWLNGDCYYKTTSGLTKYIRTKNSTANLVGDGKAIGLDILIKKNYRGSTAWIAYTLSKTTERYPIKTKRGTINDQYQRAPQDQRHEVKFAGIVNLSPFYFSANYVFGSGFPSTNPSDNKKDNFLPYNRFDTALNYKFSKKKYCLETGVSILNLFNTQNLKINNLQRIPTEQTNTLNIYNQTVPFTPTLFLSISL